MNDAFNAFDLTIGKSPILLSMPHSGESIPESIFENLNQRGQELDDSDWHIPRLYDGLLNNATILKANFHRYVIDVNRPPNGESLYPGKAGTDLCTLTDFNGAPIYKQGKAPSKTEVEQRKQDYYIPYHQSLREQLLRIKAIHGYAILYDCHSIPSHQPYLFEGQLQDLNIGTFEGKSIGRPLENLIMTECHKEKSYSTILNGRFKGGWITRHHGRPAEDIHAIQMELSQINYMVEAKPFPYDQGKADQLRKLLKQILIGLENFKGGRNNDQ